MSHLRMYVTVWSLSHSGTPEETLEIVICFQNMGLACEHMAYQEFLNLLSEGMEVDAKPNLLANEYSRVY